MPAYNPNLVLDPSPAVRIANAYQAALDYAAGRLSPADYITLQGVLTTAELPTTSDEVLTAPNPALYREGIIIIALAFVSAGGRFINPDPIATMSPVIQALRIAGALSVGGNLGITGNLDIQGELDITGDFIVSGLLTVLQGMTVSGSASVTGAMGVGQAAPASGIATPEAVQGDRLIMASGQDPATATNGTLAEDTTGDLFYKDLAGNIKYINRPQHDTGWINLSAGAGAAFARNGGFIGDNQPTVTVPGIPAPRHFAANPALTPDIYDGTGLWTGSIGTIGDLGAITRVEIWHKIDANALVFPDPAVALGVDVVTPIRQYSSAPVSEAPYGLGVSFREDNGDCLITLGEGPLVAGFPNTIWFVPGASAHGVPAAYYLTTAEIRVMAWTR